MKNAIRAAVAAIVLSCALGSAPAARAAGSAPSYFQLALAGTSLCLTAPFSPGVGSSLYLETCQNATSQLWWLNGDELVLSASALCLDAGASVYNGAAVALNACSPSSSAQQWARYVVDASQNPPPRVWVVDGGFLLQAAGAYAGAQVVVGSSFSTLLPQQWIGGP